MPRHILRRDERGASAIEFAIVAPLFLAMVLGLLVYGLYLSSAHSVAQLAADAARASVAGISDAERTQLATSYIDANAGAYPLLTARLISSEAGPDPQDNSQFRVSVRFDSSELPIWGLDAFVPLSTRTIERTSVIKRGGY